MHLLHGSIELSTDCATTIGDYFEVNEGANTNRDASGRSAGQENDRQFGQCPTRERTGGIPAAEEDCAMATAQNVTLEMNRTMAPTFLRGIRARIARARVYRETVQRLSELPDRELHDLGLSRAMIRSVAMEAARTA